MSEHIPHSRWSDIRYTPGRKDLKELFNVLATAGKDEGELVLKTLRRIQTDIVPDLEKQLASASEKALPWLIRALGEHINSSHSQRIVSLLQNFMHHPLPQIRRYSILAFGRIPKLQEQHETELLTMLQNAATHTTLLKPILETLRKAGSEPSFSTLSLWQAPPGLERLLQETLLALKRKLPPLSSATLDTLSQIPIPTAGELTCYSGLEAILAEDCRFHDIEILQQQSGKIKIAPKTAWSSLWKLRLFDSVDLFAQFSEQHPEKLAQHIWLHLVQPFALNLSKPLFSYRIDLHGFKPQRDFRIAFCGALANSSEQILNVTSQALWQLHLTRSVSGTTVRLRPSPSFDPRFLYRRDAVLGASHPTVAASLAYLATPNANDIIWDPFAGGGTELIECWLRQPCKKLLASEQNALARETLQQRFRSLNIPAPELYAGDALSWRPEGVTKIITNPPLGRRLRDTDPLDLAIAFLRHAATLLPKGGILCWTNPSHKKLGAIAEEIGFKLQRQLLIDMGGIKVMMERWAFTGIRKGA